MTIPLNRFLVMVAAALTLLVAMLATGYAVHAQSGDYSCAAGDAVADPDTTPDWCPTAPLSWLRGTT